uniref:L1 transposable element RRM domain-containing protein n=1 Tax=Erpetoichthys calabaricus TaxID=27687 RepID=A0A8C4RYD3_ERPCA
MVHESKNDLSELKVMITELKQEIKNDIKKEISSMLKTNEKISEKTSEKTSEKLRLELQELRRELQELQQDNKDSEKCFDNRFEAAFNCMLEKIEEHIQENASKLSTFADQLEDVKLAALEDGYRRNNIRIEGLPENRESPNPVKFVAELFSKIIGEDFKSDAEIAAAYRIWGLNISKNRTFIVCFEKLQLKLNVMSLLREKQEIMFENNLIHIFPDFSPSTATKRASFYNIKQHLRRADIRYSLLYPAKLKVEIQGKHYIFTSREKTRQAKCSIPALQKKTRGVGILIHTVEQSHL